MKNFVFVGLVLPIAMTKRKEQRIIRCTFGDDQGLPLGWVEVGFKGEPAQPEAKLVLHPAGTLEVRQKIQPLEIHLYKFGNAPTGEYFARGQYMEMSNAEKVSTPSFEPMKP